MTLKQVIRLIFKPIGWLFRPILIWFGWCLTVRLSSMRAVVLMPDGMAAFFVLFFGLYLPFIAVKFLYAYLAAIVAASLLFMNAVWVGDKDIYVFRMVAFIPYWRHRIPSDAWFDLYEAWEDVAPTGVAFDAGSYGGEPLHLGTSRSAEKLFEQVGALLEAEGWQRGTFGYTHPRNAKIPDSA